MDALATSARPQVAAISRNLMGKSLRRLDSSILKGPAKAEIRPC